jgi:outer membrane immunogenic protein
MKRLLQAAVAGALTLAASSALAADLPRPAYKAPIYTAPAPVFTWSGFYVGINGGYGWGKVDLSNTLGTGSISTGGGLIGGTLGYNMQSGIWVWGLEGDIDYTWIKGSDSSGICAAIGGCDGKTTWLGTARGRVGYAFDRWMPYFTGGAAFGDIKIDPSAGGAGLSKTQVGWTLGAGLEYAFLGPWSAKIEYLYVDLGKFTCDASSCGVATDVEYKESVVRAGLNYRF